MPIFPPPCPLGLVVEIRRPLIPNEKWSLETKDFAIVGNIWHPNRILSPNSISRSATRLTIHALLRTPDQNRHASGKRRAAAARETTRHEPAARENNARATSDCPRKRMDERPSLKRRRVFRVVSTINASFLNPTFYHVLAHRLHRVDRAGNRPTNRLSVAARPISPKRPR